MQNNEERKEKKVMAYTVHSKSVTVPFKNIEHIYPLQKYINLNNIIINKKKNLTILYSTSEHFNNGGVAEWLKAAVC